MDNCATLYVHGQDEGTAELAWLGQEERRDRDGFLINVDVHFKNAVPALLNFLKTHGDHAAAFSATVAFADGRTFIASDPESVTVSEISLTDRTATLLVKRGAYGLSV